MHTVAILGLVATSFVFGIITGYAGGQDPNGQAGAWAALCFIISVIAMLVLLGGVIFS